LWAIWPCGLFSGAFFGCVGFFGPNPRGLGPNPVGWAKLTALGMRVQCA